MAKLIAQHPVCIGLGVKTGVFVLDRLVWIRTSDRALNRLYWRSVLRSGFARAGK